MGATKACRGREEEEEGEGEGRGRGGGGALFAIENAQDVRGVAQHRAEVTGRTLQAVARKRAKENKMPNVMPENSFLARNHRHTLVGGSLPSQLAPGSLVPLVHAVPFRGVAAYRPRWHLESSWAGNIHLRAVVRTRDMETSRNAPMPLCTHLADGLGRAPAGRCVCVCVCMCVCVCVCVCQHTCRLPYV